jgi:hypothetical protein
MSSDWNVSLFVLSIATISFNIWLLLRTLRFMTTVEVALSRIKSATVETAETLKNLDKS